MLSFDNMRILPLAPEPFTPATDRDMVPSERRTFVRTHRTCVFGTARRADGPAMSIVYYVPTDDDELLVSTMRDRGKARAVARDAKVSLCVLDERWPFSYLQVYCDATVDEDPDLVVDVMMAVAARMSGEPLADDARPFVAAMAAEESRVALRCRPYATFAQPPRHLHRNDQAEPVTHWVSASMPWDAPDADEGRA
jgi:PPOX class probable F420-dependent enzyme